MSITVQLSELETLVSAAVNEEITQGEAVRLHALLAGGAIVPAAVGITDGVMRLVIEVASGRRTSRRQNAKRQPARSLRLAMPRNPDGSVMFTR